MNQAVFTQNRQLGLGFCSPEPEGVWLWLWPLSCYRKGDKVQPEQLGPDMSSTAGNGSCAYQSPKKYKVSIKILHAFILAIL